MLGYLWFRKYLFFSRWNRFEIFFQHDLSSVPIVGRYCQVFPFFVLQSTYRARLYSGLVYLYPFIVSMNSLHMFVFLSEKLVNSFSFLATNNLTRSNNYFVINENSIHRVCCISVWGNVLSRNVNWLYVNLALRFQMYYTAEVLKVSHWKLVIRSQYLAPIQTSSAGRENTCAGRVARYHVI